VEQEEAQAESNYNAPSSGQITDFDQLATQGLVDTGIIRNITQGMGIKTMTEVQSRTVNEALKGSDM
jgi:ATP-dependent RNA helicase MSS116